MVVLIATIPIQANAESPLLPHWIQNNVKWWEEEKISDSEFVSGINWLVNEELITVPTKLPIYEPKDAQIKSNLQGESSVAEKIIDVCGNDSHCALESIREYSNLEEKAVLKTYYDLVDYFRESDFSCHSHGHRLGEFIYEYLGNITLALSINDPIPCGGSVYHGIIMTYMSSQNFFNKSAQQETSIKEICPQNLEIEPTIERWECLHGIGHGLTIINGYDVFSAIDQCDKFEKDWERVSCSKGLFMENVENYYERGFGTIDKDNLFFPCNKIEKKYASTCYHYISRHILNQNQGNIEDSFQYCNEIPDGFVMNCYRGIGNTMARNTYFNPDYSLKCGNGDKNHQIDCYKGIAMKTADNKSIDDALKFCQSISENFRFECYGEVGKWIRMVYPDEEKRLQACLTINLDYLLPCMRANFDNLTIL